MLLERLLTGCPQLRVLATSRARLLVPYEWVSAVPGLSVSGDVGGLGDGGNLFLQRAAAAGSTPAAADYGRVAAICRGLDGMALAIELAAARLPALGLDGLEAGLADRLELLASSRRIDDRHRSLRSALDWSFALLDSSAQAVLRRVSVFAAPFTAQDAATLIAGWPPVTDAGLTASLATLADHSLLEAIAGPEATRYRTLETIRQYGSERLAAAGELADAHARHMSWCLHGGAVLSASSGSGTGAWRLAFDRIADELRSALGWAADRSQCRRLAYRLAICLAELSFVRGMPGESQHRYEQAASLAETGDAAAAALHCAAGAAAARFFGNEARRLYRAAADAALRAGDPATAARNLAQAAELINRGPGLIPDLPPAGQVAALLAEARALGVGNLSAEASIRAAEAFTGQELDPVTADLTEQALVLARRAADPLTESAAPWFDGLWRPWYAAAWAEAAVLTSHPGAADRVRRARLATAGNPIAAAVVDRAAALADANRPKVLAAATALLAAGCRYQWARTLIFAGGDDEARGQAVLAGMGATAMRAPATGDVSQ